jgi:hypothetical protein
MMIASLRRSSIAARLTWMNVLVSGIGLVLAYFSFLAYDLFVYRQACVENLAGLANVTGTNSVSSILFDDETSAEITLAALSGSSDVTSAGIYTTSGVRFAEYEREGALPSVPLPFPRPVAGRAETGDSVRHHCGDDSAGVPGRGTAGWYIFQEIAGRTDCFFGTDRAGCVSIKRLRSAVYAAAGFRGAVVADCGLQ